MNQKVKNFMRAAWAAACQENSKAPKSCAVEDGQFVFRVEGNQEKWESFCKAAGVPSHSSYPVIGDDSIGQWVWQSHADKFFGKGGPIDSALPNYEQRAPQVHMARMVQRAIEMRDVAMIEAGTGVGKCLHGDTLITKSDGTQRRIADMVGSNAEILQVDENLKVQYAPMAHCWESGEKPVLSVGTQLGREIKASKDHRFRTVDGWKTLEELSIGDRIAVTRTLGTTKDTQLMSDAEIRFLAYMIADGCCTQAKQGGGLTYTKADPAIIGDLADAVSQMGCELHKISSSDYRYGITRQKERKTEYGLRNLCIMSLESFNLAGKSSAEKFIPDAIFRLPNDQLSVFIGCLFSGDGTVDSNRPLIEYYSISKRLCLELQHLLLRFGIVSRLSVKKGKYNEESHLSWRLTVCGIENFRLFRDSIELVGAKNDAMQAIVLPAKSNPNSDTIPRESVNHLSEVKKYGVSGHHKAISRSTMLKIAKGESNDELLALAESDVYWDTITSIEDCGISKTYDIEMTGEHNFVADGFVVHNSYSYLVPALAMNKKLVVSTSNKALQMQLMVKDLPTLSQFFPGKKFALVQGKKNYMCRVKCETLGDVTISDADLRKWYGTTKTGNTEEITFTVDKLDQYTVDDYCTGKKCMRYNDCFYYEAKAQRQDADVLVTNHAMLALNYLHPGANILPETNVIVIDEAHQFPQYARSMMSQEFNFGSIKRAMDLAQKYDIDIPDDARSDFAEAIQSYIGNSPDKQVGVNIPDAFATGISLAQELWAAADEIWDSADMPNDSNEKRMSIDAGKVRSTGNKVNSFSRSTADGCVRWIENGDNLTLVNTPYDVSTFIGNMSGYSMPKVIDPDACCMCGKPFDTDFIYVSFRNQPCCHDCIDAFDPIRESTEEMLWSEWITTFDIDDEKIQDDQATPIIFTSATIAAPDMSHFMRECGIPEAMQMIAKSPFDYKSNALLYVASTNAPAPNDTQRFRNHLVDEIAALINASQGGALVLFTSYANMRYCHEALEYTLMDYKTVLKQGDMPKTELIKRFEQDGNGILFATKSFWEGVSIEDDPLRLVIIDKVPFESQSPLVNAQAEHLRRWAAKQGVTGSRLEWYPFNHQSIPRMVMDLKQGAGRLIRTQRDRGVIAILDPRIRTKQYGRKSVLPSLPDAKVTDNINIVQQFFADRAPLGKPATSMEVFALMASEEIPF